MSFAAAQARVNCAAHRVDCYLCNDPEHVLKYGWCITGKRLWRYYMLIRLTKNARGGYGA